VAKSRFSVGTPGEKKVIFYGNDWLLKKKSKKVV
jgi:hypothetical protein